MQIWKSLMLATLAVAPIAAHAGTSDGVYVGAGIGATFIQNQPTTLGARRIQDSVGGLGSLATGYAFGNGFRAELEGDFRSNEAERFGRVRTHGQRHEFGGFANGFYDVDLGPNLLGLTPYVGAGAGYEQIDVRGVRYRGGSLSGYKGNFAVQGMVGVSYPLMAIPGLAVTAEYRATAVPENMAFKVTGANSARFSTYGGMNQAGVLGVRYAFGTAASAVAAPQVAPMPVAARAPAISYLVFFDWNKDALSARASQIIKEAAKASNARTTTRIEVSGHADKTGSAPYNMELSHRRALVVASALIADGVAKERIDIRAMGESKPLVPTAVGVREPQNRRVEIVLR